MAGCRRILEDLTAWVDDELSPPSRHRVERHLATCAACHGAAETLRQSVARQTTLLRQDVLSEPHAAALWTRLSASLADEPRTYRRFGLGSLAAVGAAAGLMLVVALGALGGPEAVLIPIGAKHPPAKVQSKPGLFQEYPIIEKLEILENLDTVEAVQLDEEAPTDAG